MPPVDPVQELREIIGTAVAELGGTPSQEPTLERPPNADMGDYSTNAAMLLAGSLGEPPRDVAARLTSGIEAGLGTMAERIEIAGPGFINLSLTDAWHRRAVVEIVGSSGFGHGQAQESNVLLEFVSANPTGPVTVASGRGAAYGDSLARILAAAGHVVSREYYMNDSGTQIQKFAASIAARIRGDEPPEDGYAGDYVTELAAEFADEGLDPSDLQELELRGPSAMRGRIESSLGRFGVHYDTWSSERALIESGALELALADLGDGGYTYESEGALWLRTSEHGDDKDRVLVRSDGEPTYFAADIAYHRDKLQRGAGQMITPLGADHHGYVARMKAAIACLGVDPARYEAPIMQLVSVIEGGARASMSKRKGEFVTLDELIADIGRDAARFFLVQRSLDTTLDIDLELARSQSQDNPVYYVQYAHARIASILRKAEREAEVSGPEAVVSAAAAVAQLPCEPSERALIRRLLDFPWEVATAAERRQPHRIAVYSQAVAADFHSFYRDCRVVGADEESGVDGLQSARLAVCLAASSVIAASLDLLGISAPDQM